MTNFSSDENLLNLNFSRRSLLTGIAGAVGLPLFGCTTSNGAGNNNAPSQQPLPAGANTTVIENAKLGTTTWQLTKRVSNHTIEGYASAVSVNRGEQISLFISTVEAAYSIEFFRLGWYGGLGGRSMGDAIRLPGNRQVTPLPDPQTGMVQCKWTPSYTFIVPNTVTADSTDWPSGIYLTKLTALASGTQSYITFVVRDDARISDLLFQASVNTYQAYNPWGGTSLYRNDNAGANASGVYSAPQAVKVSFDRPYTNDRANAGAGEVFSYEYNMVRWLEKEGYDVSYSTDLDTHLDTSGAALLRHKGFLIVGHDEYWTLEMLNNIESARDGGTGIGYFGGNACSWQVRYEPNTAGIDHRVMVGYKQFALQKDPNAASNDPAQRQLTTFYFRDPPVNRRQDALLGITYNEVIQSSGPTDIIIENSSNAVFANTGLKDGDKIAGLLLGEVDALATDTPIQGIVRLAHSPCTLRSGHASFGDMSIYQASGGAYVFSAGTLGWPLGLDPYNFYSGAPVPPESTVAKQITRNVLALFGAKPTAV